jgi:Protein kinase domain
MTSAMTWGPYRALRTLGAGGMGKVWEVEHVDTGGRYALKALKWTRSTVDEDRERFVREGEALAGLVHPHLVRVHSADLTSTRPYLVQELLSGGDLGQRLEGGPLAISDVVRLARELAGALDYTHQRGLVHRDLKPENILFDAEGRAKIADFGLVRRAEDTSGLTVSGTILGTPAYMAPEQALDGKRAAAPADIYSFGAVLYAALVGGAPFTEFEGGLLGFLVQVLEEEPPPIEAARPDAPRWLVELCERCMDKDPEQRPTAGEVLGLLRARQPRRKPPGRGRDALIAAAVMSLIALALVAGLTARDVDPQAAPGPPPPDTPSGSSPEPIHARPAPGEPRWDGPVMRWLERGGGEPTRHMLVRFLTPERLIGFDARLTLVQWTGPDWKRSSTILGSVRQSGTGPTVIEAVGDAWVYGCGDLDRRGRGLSLQGPGGPWVGASVPACGLVVAERLLIGTHHGQVQRYELSTGRRLSDVGAFTGTIRDMAYLEQRQRLLVVTSDSPGETGSLVLARLEGEGEATTLARIPVPGGATSLAVHASGEWCVVGSNIGFLGTYRISLDGLERTGQALGADQDSTSTRAHHGAVRDCAFSPWDQNLLYSVASGFRENDLKAWRVSGPEHVEEVGRLPLPQLPYSLAVSPLHVAIGTVNGSVLLVEPLERWR